MKEIVLIIFISCGGLSHAQTKLIAHKSHSGSSKNFNKTLNEDLFNIGNSNFGMAPERLVRNSKLDTVILLSDRKAVIVTSEHCSFDREDRANKSRLWSAGKDTVIDHDVFNADKSVEEIKKILKEEYYFANPIESIVFIGFDGNFKPKNEKLIVQEEKVDTLSEEIDNPNVKEQKHRTRRNSPFMTSIFWSLLSLILRGTI